VTSFWRLLVPAELREAVSGRAWLAAMLDAERSLASAGARAGIVPAEAATAIAAACDPDAFDPDELVEQGLAADALDPATYVGSAEALVDRALARHTQEAAA
jgi:3-carboxy-cis,cis-muconate cycloisomerase